MTDRPTAWLRRTTDESASIPLVLLVAIIVAGLLLALFMDVSTGVRLAANDRDFNQAIQVADAGLQDAFVELAALEDDELPPVGSEYGGGQQIGQIGNGEYRWTARRVGTNRWQVRSEGTTNDVVRAMEATMGPENLFALAAFADVLLELRGKNEAFSYNGTDTDTGRGSVGSNTDIVLRGNATVDWVIRYNDATYEDGGKIRPGGGIETGDEQVLPDLGSMAYNEENGACADVEREDDIADVLPLVQGATYCVSQATFPKGQHTIVSSGEPAQDAEPTRIYIAPSGDLDLQGQGKTHCTGVSCVNWDVGDTQPDATKLEIYLAGGGGEVLANNHTVIAAGIYAPLSNCSGPNARGDVYGSIVCRTLDTKGGWRFHYDERFDDVGAEFFKVSSVREETPNTTSFG